MKEKTRATSVENKLSEAYQEQMKQFKDVSEYHNPEVAQLGDQLYKEMMFPLMNHCESQTLHATMIALARIAASTIFSLYLSTGKDHIPAFSGLLNEVLDEMDAKPEIQAMRRVVERLRKATANIKH